MLLAVLLKFIITRSPISLNILRRRRVMDTNSNLANAIRVICKTVVEEL